MDAPGTSSALEKNASIRQRRQQHEQRAARQRMRAEQRRHRIQGAIDRFVDGTDGQQRGGDRGDGEYEYRAYRR
jgi:hypothetical protein